MVRAAQKGDLKDPSPEVADVADDISVKDAKKFAKTKHKGLPEKKTVDEGAAWTKKSGKNKEGGLNEKGRKSYERENPGSDLKAPQPEGGSRKKSFCARMGGMKKKLTSAKTANDPDSRINKSLRKWKCNEAKVDKGRSDYGKASIRNYRHSGPDTVDPAMFDPENKRGKTIDKRREEHKARRGKKGAKVPTYKKESFSDWRTDLGEEGYDRMRDDRLVKYGIGHDGSDRKAGSSKRTPDNQKIKGKTVLQKETEKKYGKGVSALDVVKAKIRDKHGKDAIMKPKK